MEITFENLSGGRGGGRGAPRGGRGTPRGGRGSFGTGANRIDMNNSGTGSNKKKSFGDD